MARDDRHSIPDQATRTPLGEGARRRAARVAIAIGAAGALVLACRGAPTPAPDAGEEDRRAILALLQARGSAAVMVMLALPAGGDTADAASRRAAIASAQDDVLGALDPADFTPSQRYASVPALAGVLRTERGLRLLLAHPRVRRVSLDSGGTGMR